MLNYLKPQTPIELGNNYIYPLTTADQVILNNGNRLNSLFKKTIKETVVLRTTDWSETKPYTQTITLKESTDDYNVDANVAYGDGDNAALNKAAGCISYIKKNHKKITFYCLKSKPEINIPVEITGTCRNTIADITIEEGIDTSDATATAEDILIGKTAYVDGELITGSYEALELNFEVVGGTTQPDNPTENMIWVNTNTPITGYYFSITEPENMVEGEVWIKTGDDSDVAFDIVDGAKIYPVSAKQYVGGVLVDVSAMSYKSGTFVPWITELYLYNNGDQCTSVTGGWTKVEGGGEKISFASTKITFDYGTSGGRSAAAYTVNKIDVSKYKTIVVTGKITNLDVSEEERSLTFGLTSSKTANDPSNWNSSKTRDIKGVFEETLDISKVSSSYYVCLHAHGSDLEIYTVSLK